MINKTLSDTPIEHTVCIKQFSNITTYLFSTIQYQCKSTCLQMENTAVPKPIVNSIHVQYLCGEILNTSWKKTDLIGHMN